MKYQYKADIDKLLPLPEIRKPKLLKYSVYNNGDMELYHKDIEVYNNWLLKGITPSDELRKSLSDGGEYAEGKHFKVGACSCKIGTDCPRNSGKWFSPCELALLIEQKPLSEVPVILSVKFESYEDGIGWIASINEMPGMVASGNTKAEAWQELMLSLRVKIAYDSGISPLELVELDKKINLAEEAPLEEGNNKK